MAVIATRRERVILDIESDLAATLTRDAVAAKLLARELNSLGRQSVETSRVTQSINRDNDTLAKSAIKADASINKLTGRLRLFADVAAILGPALVPIGAVGIPAVAGLANQFGVAALAGGTAILAFQGVGTALKAVNDYALEPTAENLEKARIAMQDLSPAARDMVRELQSLRDVGKDLRDAGAEGLFPGMLDMFDELEARIPEVERIISNVSTTLGSLMRDMGEDLASKRWDAFFNFLATDATTTLAGMGKVVGSLAHGFAELWMAFDPLNDGMTSWMADVAAGFDSWASGLAQTEGFREFIDYIQTNGPQVADTFVALGNAVLQIVEASAPLGGPVLHGLEAVAKTIAAIADSNLGTPIMMAVGAMALLSRATLIYEKASATAWGSKAKANILGMNAALRATTTEQQRATMSSQQLAKSWDQRAASVRAGLATFGKGAAVLGALTLATTGAADGMGLTNTMTLGLMGTLAGPFGVAAGAGAGLLLDMKAGADAAADSTERFNRVLDEGSDKMVSAEIDRLTMKLNDLSSIQPWEFGKWVEAGGLGAPEIEKIRAQIDALRASLDAPNKAGQGLAGMLAGNLAPALGMTADQFDLAAMNAQEFANALQGLAGFLEKRDALRNYQQALDDFTKSIKENGKSFDTTTDKGRANEEALDGIANSAIQVAEHMKGLDRVRTLTAAAKDIQALAKQLGIPQREVQGLIDKLEKAARTDAKPEVQPQGIPKANSDVDGIQRKFQVLDQFKATPLVAVLTGNSMADLAALQARMASIQSKTVYVNVRTIGGPQAGPMAEGGTVPGPRYPYADKTLILAAPGEEIITNRRGEADRFRADRAAGRIPAYADGGTVAGRGGSYLDLARAEIGASTFARSMERASRATSDDERTTRHHESAVKSAERALRLQEKALDEARAATTEARDGLRELKDASKQFSDAVASNFRLNFQMNADSSMSALEQFRASLASQTGTAGDFLHDLRQGENRGLSGSFYNYLAQLGDPALLDQVVNMRPGEVRALERDYSKLQRLSGAIGNTAAVERYGADIREQTHVLADALKEQRQARRATERAEKHLKDINHDGPERTGQATARALSGVAANGYRRRRR